MLDCYWPRIDGHILSGLVCMVSFRKCIVTLRVFQLRLCLFILYRAKEENGIFSNAKRNLVLLGVVIMAEWICTEKLSHYAQQHRISLKLSDLIHFLLPSIAGYVYFREHTHKQVLRPSIPSLIGTSTLCNDHLVAFGLNYHFVSHSNSDTYFLVAHAPYHWTSHIHTI